MDLLLGSAQGVCFFFEGPVLPHANNPQLRASLTEALFGPYLGGCMAGVALGSICRLIPYPFFEVPSCMAIGS